MPASRLLQPSRRVHLLQRFVVAALLLGAALGTAAQALPAPQTSDSGVRFVSGGIGEAESAAFKREAARWPLTVEIYARSGGRNAFTADADVTLTGAKGATVLQARTEGPFLLADVPPGRYDVQVMLDGKTSHQPVTVKAGGPARSVFVFDR